MGMACLADACLGAHMYRGDLTCCPAVLLVPQGIVVQKTGNFTRVSILFGLFLLIFGAFLATMKYVLRWQDRKAARLLAASRVGSDPGSSTSAATLVAAAGAGGQVAGLDGRGHKDAGAAAAVGGTDTVLVQSDRGDAMARPRMPAYSAQDRV